MSGPKCPGPKCPGPKCPGAEGLKPCAIRPIFFIPLICKSGALHTVPLNRRERRPFLQTYPKIDANGAHFYEHTLNRRKRRTF
jgi:hypothetical protein